MGLTRARARARARVRAARVVRVPRDGGLAARIVLVGLGVLDLIRGRGRVRARVKVRVRVGPCGSRSASPG